MSLQMATPTGAADFGSSARAVPGCEIRFKGREHVLLVVGSDGPVRRVDAGFVIRGRRDDVQHANNESCAGAVGYGLQDGVDGLRVAAQEQASFFGHDDEGCALVGEGLGVLGVGGDDALHCGGLFGEGHAVGVKEADFDGLVRGGRSEAEDAEEDGGREKGECRCDDERCVREASAAEIAKVATAVGKRSRRKVMPHGPVSDATCRMGRNPCCV